MKFFSFLASTMLIVLISQHSILALPLSETTEQPCAAGLERINGQCVPISSTTNTNALESSSFATVTMIMPTESAVTQTLPKANACPPGTERAQNGQCEPIQLSTSTAALLESSSISSETTINPELTTVAISGKAGKMEDCPQGTVRDQSGQCQPVERSSSTEALPESSSLSTETTFTTEVNNIDASTVAGKSNACPPNTRRAENGQCEPVHTTTQVDDVETTTELNEMSRKPVNLAQCPEGTKRDDDGSCQEINPTNKTKTTDPKILLKKDGSCPDGYKKVNEQCLYIGTKVNVTSVPGEVNALDRVQPRVGADGTSNLNKLVRANEDGSCPVGTQQYENGLCIIINQPLSPVANYKITCGDSYELVNGKCVRRNLIQPNNPLESGTESMTVATEQATTNEKVNESTVSVELATEAATAENKLDKDQPKNN